MSLIKIPNLPEGKVKVAVIEGSADERIGLGLEERGIELIKTCKFPGVYRSISYHPDIVIHHIGGSKIIYAPGTNPEFLSALKGYGFDIIEGKTVLSDSYPGNIAYNVARVGRFAVHNFRYTDSVLKKELENEGVEFIDVKQGYSKCSVCILNENCIITSDKGIARAAESKGIEVFLIEPDENILLPGLDRGFIGGSTGLIDKYTLAVTGCIEKLKSAERIKEFLRIKEIEIVSLGEGQVIDVGSIIPLLTF